LKVRQALKSWLERQDRARRVCSLPGRASSGCQKRHTGSGGAVLKKKTRLGQEGRAKRHTVCQVGLARMIKQGQEKLARMTRQVQCSGWLKRQDRARRS
jgi:hypothetical protein